MRPGPSPQARPHPEGGATTSGKTWHSYALLIALLCALLGISVPAGLSSQSSPPAHTPQPSATTIGERGSGLTFRVVDGDDGRLLPGVTVEFSDQSQRSIGRATSDTQGVIVLAVPSGVTTVTAVPREPSGYVGFPVQTPPSAPTPVDIPIFQTESQWTSWGKTLDREHVGPDVGLPEEPSLWSYDAQNNVEFPPSLAYGLVLYGSYHGFINANSQRDGHIVWQVYPGTEEHPSKFANQMVASTWKENGRRVARLFYADLTGILGARDVFTGAKVWEITSATGPGTNGRTVRFRSFESSPLIVGETLYVATRYSDNAVRAGLWAFDRRTGAVRWCRPLGASIATKICSSPAYSNGRIFQATYDGTVFGIDAKTGEVLWRTWLDGELYSTPAVQGVRLYIGNKSTGRVYCLNATTGRVMWKRRLPATVHSSPAVYDGRIYVGSGSRFMALSAEDGHRIWELRTRTHVIGSATVLRGIVYFSDFGRTYACNARTGKLVWRFDDGRYSPVTATRNLILVCGRRVIYAFKPGS